VPAEERDRLESEPVADFPDTELRITSPAGGPPAIAEVVFPPGMSLRDAKAYLFRELEQLALGSRPGEGSWSEVGGKVLWSVGSEPVGRERLELAPGVTELVAVVPAAATARTVPLPWTPPAVEFDSAAGWDRESAEGWLRKHQRFPDAGRTVRLEVPHRHRPGLAAFLADVVYPNESRPPAASASDGPDVLFLPVPGLPGRREEPDANGQADHPPPSPRRIPLGLRGGAGLEIDLSDPRQRERIPTDLRGGLPERGMVNLAEAQAIARFLDAELSKGEPAVTVAVLAMTAAQAELTRRVCRQSPALAARLDRWVVDVPPAVRHREFDTVVVSLTRSHTHRAVPFGEAAGWLALALTRPRTQLVIVGDPGTLARRAQWESSLDHLNERQAAREREQVSALVRYLTGQESGDHFRLLAGYRC
jgi:hypothetical protein